jgi:hypothetical protein
VIELDDIIMNDGAFVSESAWLFPFGFIIVGRVYVIMCPTYTSWLIRSV